MGLATGAVTTQGQHVQMRATAGAGGGGAGSAGGPMRGPSLGLVAGLAARGGSPRHGNMASASGTGVWGPGSPGGGGGGGGRSGSVWAVLLAPLCCGLFHAPPPPQGPGHARGGGGCPRWGPVPAAVLFVLGFQLGWLCTGPLPPFSSPLPLPLALRAPANAAAARAQAEGAGAGASASVLSRLEAIEQGLGQQQRELRQQGLLHESRKLEQDRWLARLAQPGKGGARQQQAGVGAGGPASSDSAWDASRGSDPQAWAGGMWRPGNCTPGESAEGKGPLLQGTVAWQPQKDKFLLAMCSGGQMSNRLACLRQNMLDAALLNRTLVLPSHGIDYNYHNLLDLGAPAQCFGPGRVITLDEYRARLKGGPVRVDRTICHVHTYQAEEVCSSLQSRYTALGLEFARTDVARRRTPGPWFKYPSLDFLRKFSGAQHARLLAFSNMFGVGGRELRFHGTAPLRVLPPCRGFLVPSRPIQDVAVGFVNMFLGASYVAVHLRRGDFFQHCLRGPGKGRLVPCYQPLQQVARCVASRLTRLQHDPVSPFHPAPVGMLFVASNAEPEEMQALDAALAAFMGRKVAMVRLPALASKVAAQWAEPLLGPGLGQDPEVLSLVDKTICALSTFFFGTPGSTFSNDILRLREWWQQGTGCDAYICPPQLRADILPFSSPSPSNATTPPAPPASALVVARQRREGNSTTAGGAGAGKGVSTKQRSSNSSSSNNSSNNGNNSSSNNNSSSRTR